MQGILANLKYVVALHVESQSSNFQQVRTRWTFSRAVMVFVGISKLYLWDLIFVHPGVKIKGRYYQVIIISWVVHFLRHSVVFVDEIKLKYSLANTTLQYVRVAISGCVHCTVLLVKMSLSELL